MFTTLQRIENEACRLAVGMGGGTPARNALAAALRAYRKAGDREQAKWLQRHIHYVTGHLWKPTQPTKASQ